MRRPGVRSEPRPLHLVPGHSVLELENDGETLEAAKLLLNGALSRDAREEGEAGRGVNRWGQTSYAKMVWLLR